MTITLKELIEIRDALEPVGYLRGLHRVGFSNELDYDLTQAEIVALACAHSNVLVIVETLSAMVEVECIA